MAQIEANKTKDIEAGRRAFVAWWRGQNDLDWEQTGLCNSIEWGLWALTQIDRADNAAVLRRDVWDKLERLKALINREPRVQ